MEENKKKKRLEELRGMSVIELIKEEKELRKKIYDKNEQQSYRINLPVEKPHLFKQYKREIAQVLTIIKEKEFK